MIPVRGTSPGRGVPGAGGASPARRALGLLVGLSLTATLLVAPPPVPSAAQDTGGASGGGGAEEADQATANPGTDCVEEVPGLEPHTPARGVDAVLMIHGWTGTTEAWTQPIDRAVNQHVRPVYRSFADQVRRMGSTDVWLLDYHDSSTRWVTDPAVGGVVAEAIDCLADAYDRPIGVAAHSMGGLAVRQVAGEDARHERIAGLVTFGTPHTGSDHALAFATALGMTTQSSAFDWVTPAVVQVLRACGIGTRLVAGACEALGDLIEAVDTPAGRALLTGSRELAALPDLPTSLDSLSLAGDVEVVHQVSGGLFYQDLTSVELGDMAVFGSSATATGAQARGWDCRHNLRVGPVPNVGERIRGAFGLIHDDGSEHSAWTLASSPCAHWSLMRTTEITNEALGFLYEQLKSEGAPGGETLEVDDGPSRDGAEPVRADGRPIMFVVDVSGSMSQPDDRGVVRIDAARSGLNDVLYKQRPGTVVGVRTYPDPGGGACNGGRTLQPLAPLDASRTAALVDGLVPGGNTPTGPALLAAVDELREAGYDEGQIVLVSDGESNCGDPPCDVAAAVRDAGFDLTIDTFGFTISEAGRQELDCISDATGGQHFDAEDGEQLGEQLLAASGAAIELSVAHESRVPSGLPVAIEATLHNPTGVLAEDVQVTLAFGDAGADTILASAVPSRYQVGNLPPDGTVTRRWEVTAGQPGSVGTLAPSVTAWGTDVDAVSSESTVEVTEDLPGLDELDGLLTEVEAAGGRLAILGDSYSSGEGAGDYLPGTDQPDNRCHRSLHTTAVSLFGDDRVEILACSGAVIENLYQAQAGREGTRAQLVALDELGDPPHLALMTIGGNDAGFADLVRRCLLPGDCTSDHGWVSGVLRDVELLGPRLERAYVDVAEAVASANDGARVAVLAYPGVLPHRGSQACTGFSADEIVFANQVVRALNDTAEQAVVRARQRGADVLFVPNTSQAVLPSNTACHPEPYVVSVDLLVAAGALVRDGAGWLLPGDGTARRNELLHPNVDGYRAMTHALTAWSESHDESAVTPLGTDDAERRDLVVDESPATVTVRLDDGEQVELDLRRGDRLELDADGFAPGSTVSITLQSRPVRLAVVEADDDGRVRAGVQVPLHVEAGSHIVRLEGVDAAGEVRELTAALGVRPERPGWLLPAAVGAAALALAGLGGLVGLRVTRRRLEADRAGEAD